MESKVNFAGLVAMTCCMCTQMAQAAPESAKAPENAIMHSDGSRTILRSQQLPEANQRHSRWCAEQGGVDVTNDGDVTLSAGAADAVICAYPDGPKPGFSGAYVPRPGKSMPKSIEPSIDIEAAPPLTPDLSPAGEPEGCAKPFDSSVAFSRSH